MPGNELSSGRGLNSSCDLYVALGIRVRWKPHFFDDCVKSDSAHDLHTAAWIAGELNSELCVSRRHASVCNAYAPVWMCGFSKDQIRVLLVWIGLPVNIGSQSLNNCFPSQTDDGEFVASLNVSEEPFSLPKHPSAFAPQFIVPDSGLPVASFSMSGEKWSAKFSCFQDAIHLSFA